MQATTVNRICSVRLEPTANHGLIVVEKLQARQTAVTKEREALVQTLRLLQNRLLALYAKERESLSIWQSEESKPGFNPAAVQAGMSRLQREKMAIEAEIRTLFQRIESYRSREASLSAACTCAKDRFGPIMHTLQELKKDAERG